MSKSFLLIFLFLVITVGCGDDNDAAENAVEVLNPEDGDIAAGEALFLDAGNRCSECHGTNGTGGTRSVSIVGRSASRIQTAVRTGPGDMPALSEGALSSEDLNDLTAYVLQL